MWDSNSPLQLLKTMPSRLGKEELEKLQAVLEADKYKNSLISGFDLCGMYAPFCRGCSKASIYPCAVAYVNMMKESGMDVDVAARPVEEVRHHTYDSKTNRSDKHDIVQNLCQIVAGRLTGSDTRNKSAVLLNVSRNFFGIELYLRIEEREEQNQKSD